MPLVLRWKAATTLPLEADLLRPDALAGLSAAEVSRKAIPLGNGRVEVGELFEVGGRPEGGHLVLEGDLRRARRIGAGLGSGLLTVRGDAGMHLGAEMTGGAIDAVGDVARGAGMGMAGAS